jgi:phosphoserine phosphatase RsbX
MTLFDDTRFVYAVAARPLRGEAESGDLHAVIRQPHGLLIAVADGLGHGYEAAVASKLAVITLTAQAHLPINEMIKCCHEALLRTRGVALSVASLDYRHEVMTWLSVGNVAAVLLRTDDAGRWEREHILMRNGVVGHRLPPLRSTTLSLRRRDILIFATDGIRDGFQGDFTSDPNPQVVADRILEQYGKATDDALVLVGRWDGARMVATH